MHCQKLNQTTIERVDDVGEPERAFDRIRDAVLELRSDEVERPNATLLKAAKICLGACERVEPLRPELVKLHDFSVEDLDALRDIANAVVFVETMPKAPSRLEVRALVDEGTTLRAALVGAARTLADWGHLRGDALDRVCRGRSHLELVRDLHGVALLYRSAWSDIDGKTPVPEAKVDRADALSAELMKALVRREVIRGDPKSDVMELRARVFTLLKRTYARVAFGVRYLRRFHGDAAELVPPMTPHRGKQRAESTTSSDDETAPATAPPAEVPGPEPGSDSEGESSSSPD